LAGGRSIAAPGRIGGSDWRVSAGSSPVSGKRLQRIAQDMSTDSRLAAFNALRIKHWNAVAAAAPEASLFGRAYYRRLAEIYRFLVPAGKRVLEVGCGNGDLLAALRPAEGLGVDFSPEMVRLASARHAGLRFAEADAHDLRALEGPFDVIVLSDLLNDLFDVQAVLGQVRRLCHPRTRVILNFYSHLWELPLTLAAAAGLARSKLDQNWLTVEDVQGLLELADLDLVDQRQEILLPAPIPGLRELANEYLVKLWPFRYFALTNVIVARPAPEARAAPAPRVSVIVAARNETGNVPRIFAEVPEMGGGTEIVFVEGHSTDGTYEAIEAAMRANPRRKCSLYRQTGVGKGDAVRLGFDKASGDILMILDADLTVAPADLVRFYDAISSGKGEFINGVRLVYPMEDEAMRFFNFLGNKFFSLAFSWLLGQPIKDTLCGTKVIWRSDYATLVANRAYFGDFDPFGDFDLLFGAAKLNLKIVEVPIRYGARRYGTTNIQRWKHGWMLLKMVVFAARRIKFI
jgi:SAM-dependent methyltransferase